MLTQISPALFLLARFISGGYFIWTGSAKLNKTRLFWSQIMDYDIVGARLSRLIASVLPPLEFVAGLFYAAGLYSAIIGLILLVLLLAFTGAVISALVRKKENDCGCASNDRQVSPVLILRNAILAGLVAAGVFSASPNYLGSIIVMTIGAATVLIFTSVAYRSLGK